MKHVVDSSGWIEYFTNGPNAEFYAPVINDPENLLVPSIVLYEVFKHVLLHSDEENALQSVAIMARATEVPLDRDIALEAALVSTGFKLAMADSIILATARFRQAELWTQDAHFQKIEGVHFIEKK